MMNEEKAAVMLLSLDEDLAAEVMKNLRPAEIRRIGRYMTRIWSRNSLSWPGKEAEVSPSGTIA